MRREEIAFAIDLAAREGWNPRLHDAECFFAADPGGFLMGEPLGEAVGCISAVSRRLEDRPPGRRRPRHRPALLRDGRRPRHLR
jgi:hypothetical protein